MKSIVYRMFAIVLVIIISAKVSAEQIIDEKEFSLSLPNTWKVLNINVKGRGFTANLYDEQSSVIQLSVLAPNKGVSLDAVREKMRSTLGKDETKQNWMLLRAEVKNTEHHGEIEEEFWLEKSGELMSVTRNVYGENKLAIFTYTFKVSNEGGAQFSKIFTNGFKWKIIN